MLTPLHALFELTLHAWAKVRGKPTEEELRKYEAIRRRETWRMILVITALASVFLLLMFATT